MGHKVVVPAVLTPVAERAGYTRCALRYCLTDPLPTLGRILWYECMRSPLCHFKTVMISPTNW